MEQIVARGAAAARDARFPRLHPSQDHSRMPIPRCIGQAGLYADRLSVNVELPREQSLAQIRAAEEARRPSAEPWRRLRLRIDEAKEERRAAASAPQLRARGPEHADDRRRRRRPATSTSCARSATLYGSYGLQARLLFRVQPHSGRRRAKLPPVKPPLHARAPALSGRLAVSLLRLLPSTRSRRRRTTRRHAADSTSTRNWRGRSSIARVSPST